MADDTLELFQPIFENSPQSCPKNMLPYEHGALLPQQQRALNDTKVPTVRENQQYLAAHPEVNAIVSLLLRNVFASRPKNIAEFMGNFMARPEVEDEIRAYLYKEMHTGLGPGTESPDRQESKCYHFLNEERGENEDDFKDDLAEDSLNDNMTELHKMHDKIKAKKRLRTSISEATDGDELSDLYKMSQISGPATSNPAFGYPSLFESDPSIGGMKTLLTLLEPRISSSMSQHDSIGSCSLLEDHSPRKFASDTDNHIIIQGSLFKQSNSDLNQGSSMGDHLNEEMMMHLPKRNVSGVSAISDQGIFKAVEIEKVPPHSRKRGTGKGAQASFQEEDEEQEQDEGNKEEEEQ